MTIDIMSFRFQVAANTPSMYSQELFQLSQYLQVKVNLENYQFLKTKLNNLGLILLFHKYLLKKYWLNSSTKQFKEKSIKNKLRKDKKIQDC